MKSICIYCGSNPGKDPIYAETAETVGRYLGENSYRLVYGGGRRGLMGIVADATLAAGGEVTGVIPTFLVEAETAHTGLADLRVVADMHERKMTMMQEGDAFISLPGGIGTMEELFESFTWHQLGINDKPCGMLNTAGYYDPLITLMDTMEAQGFLRKAHRDALSVADEIDTLVKMLANYERSHETKW